MCFLIGVSLHAWGVPYVCGCTSEACGCVCNIFACVQQHLGVFNILGSPPPDRPSARMHNVLPLCFVHPFCASPGGLQPAGVSHKNRRERKRAFRWSMSLNSGPNSTRRLLRERERRQNEIFGVGEEKAGGRLCFSLLPLHFRSFYLSRGVFSLTCGHESRLWTTQIVRLGFSGVILCEPRRPAGRRALNFTRERQNIVHKNAQPSTCYTQV